MPTLTHHELVLFFLQLSIMLALGKLLGELMKKAGQPAIIGEILAGIVLGPNILGFISQDFWNFLFPTKGSTPVAMQGLTSVSIVLLLFIAGLEVELRAVLHQGKKAVLTSFSGIICSFSIAFLLSFFLPTWFGIKKSDLIFSFFMGTALAITALPVIARTLMDLGLFRTQIGMLIIASAMIDDILGWVLFSIILGATKPTQEASMYGLYFTVAGTLLFASLMLTLGRRIINQVLPWVNKQVSFPGGILSVSITLGMLGASFTEAIGIHAIFGSFIVGIALGDSIHMSKKTKEIIHDFVSNIFAPLFFVSIGTKVNFVQNFDLSLVLIILVLAFIGKMLGGFIGARLGGFVPREALAIGSAMNARGAMGIILADLAQQAHLIDQYMFVALVIMSIITSMTSGYLIKTFIPQDTIGMSEPNGFVILGDNEIAHTIAKFLVENKVPVLIADPDKKKIVPKYDFEVYQGNFLEQHALEKLDLSRYGYFLALSENDEANIKVCKLFATEFDEEHSLRLISKAEWQSASLALPQNLLFRATHWNFTSLERTVKMPDIKIIDLDFEVVDRMEVFIALHNRRQRIVPLFIKQGKAEFHPISSYPIKLIKGARLIYLEVPDTSKAAKGKL
jgi:Kef-type K+ transport system membrane component KefB